MNNQHLDDRLSAYLDGELEPADVSEAEAHVRRCAHCAAVLTHIADVRHTVRSLPAVDVPPAFFDRLLADDRAGGFEYRRRRRGLRLGLANVGAAAAIWVLLLGIGDLSAPAANAPLAPSVRASVETHQAAMTSGIGTGDNAADSVGLSSRWQLPAAASEFRLVSASLASGVLRAEYSDGSDLVTLSRQRGRLDTSHLPAGSRRLTSDGDRAVAAGDGQWAIMFVEKAPYVYTVVAPARSGLVDQMVAALPSSGSRSISDRIVGAADGLVDCFGLRG